MASKSRKEHIIHLRGVLKRLRSAALVLNLPKCTFGRSSVDFLGHLVSPQGIRPLAAKVEALHSHPQPNTLKELQQFLGLLNFYRRFLPSTAKMLAPPHRGPEGLPSESHKDPVVGCHADRLQPGQEQPLHHGRAVPPLPSGQTGSGG